MNNFTQQFNKYSKQAGFSSALIFTVLITISFSFLVDIVAAEVCPLMPVPKVYRDHGRSWQLATPEKVAIVIGSKATAPEKYAAERLQGLIQHRYGQTLKILAEDQVHTDLKQVFLLGQISTHTLLDRLCRDNKIDLGETSPGPDGFVIEYVEDGDRQTVIVGGSNPRGVIYGQDVLFDLMKAQESKIVLPVVTVRDWPSIAWRGRPHSVLQHHLVPGALDAYVRARINFTDVRDNPAVKPTIIFAARKASMGFPAGVPIDKPPVKRMIDESHRRGLFVYGTVSCCMKEKGGDAVVRTFEELLELGVDGLWISFDDSGAGNDAFGISQRVLELGKRHNITGRKIAITPPDGDYQVIDRDFNRKCAAVPGMEEVQWMFTRVPCQADVEMAKNIGLKRLPGWWHNLEGFEGGFLHNGGVLCTLRADLKPAYVNLQPLIHGWGRPKYEQLRNAPNCTDTVLLWCVCNGWPEEYEIAAMGLWAWNPEGHDWSALCSSIYNYVYGPDQVETARQFDNKLGELKSLFHMPLWQFSPNKGWPCRLKKADNRPKALALIDQLQSLADILSARAPAKTAIDPTRLENIYLEPMRTTLIYARKMALLDYPEDSLTGFDNRMFKLIGEGNVQAVRQAMDEIRPKVETQLTRISTELQDLKGIQEYTSFWKKRITDVKYWEKEAAKQRKKMK